MGTGLFLLERMREDLDLQANFFLVFWAAASLAAERSWVVIWRAARRSPVPSSLMLTFQDWLSALRKRGRASATAAVQSAWVLNLAFISVVMARLPWGA